MGRVLSIEIVVLATSAAILLVRGCDLENRNPGLLHETEKACAIASSRLYTDVLQVTEGPHPGEHLAIALTGGGEGSRFDHPILLIHDRCDMKILVGIHAADDATGVVTLSERRRKAGLPCDTSSGGDDLAPRGHRRGA